MDPKQFKEQSSLKLAWLAGAIDDYLWSQAGAYGAWPAQTDYYVAHTTRLLALVAFRYSVA